MSKELTPAEKGEKAAREENQKCREIEHLAVILKHLVRADFNGDKDDLIDNFEDDLEVIIGCDYSLSRMDDLANTILKLYNFIK